MDQITGRLLRQQKWSKNYEYKGVSLSFETFSCAIPGISLTHERKTPTSKVKVVYSAFGRRTESPSQLVRIYNEEVRRQSGFRDATGSAESLKRRSRTGATGL